MRPVIPAVSIVLGLVAAGVLINVVPIWFYRISLIAAVVVVSVELYRSRHVVLRGG
jgi:hypothetical protein